MNQLRIIFFLTLMPLFLSFSQGIVESNTKEEALSKLREMYPKEDKFLFKIPDGWEKISLSAAKIIKVNDEENIDEAQKIIDGKTSTSWKTKSYYTKPEVVIDLGENYKFNRIVLYNRETFNRGSGGGNNALKTVEISCSNGSTSSYKPLGKYELHGPKAACVKIKGAGQICTFIDDPDPNIIEIPSTDARYLKMNFIDAYWENDIPDNWRDSFSLTEIMLFNK
jgi:F5/8 type C domain